MFNHLIKSNYSVYMWRRRLVLLIILIYLKTQETMQAMSGLQPIVSYTV